ncbi:hypothetical protein G6F56_002676 [Rhizopus delemar]|nr:hypothetical protein G6F56_002676 [Rhizopus delemar]
MISNPRQFKAFAITCPTFKALVHRMDLSAYTLKGLRLSVEKAKSIIRTKDLVRLFDGCHQLKELCVGEELMETFVSPPVLQSVFQKSLRTLDLTGCSKMNRDVILQCFVIPKQLENISFFMNSAISQDQVLIPFFDQLIANGNQLKRLDFGRTTITNKLFSHLPSPDTLIRLSLMECCYLSCCSDTIRYIERCQNLVELNIEAISRFCKSCLHRIIRSFGPKLESLNLGNQSHLDETHIRALPRLKYLSLSYCHNLDLQTVLDYIKSNELFYINLQNVFHPDIFSQLPKTLQVIEIIDSPRYPHQWGPWKFRTHGHRTFYSQIDPSAIYSNKIIMGDPLRLSPMNRYYAYS